MYDAVSPAYVEADLMNKAAINHAQGGHDDYDDSIRARLQGLRASITTAREAIAGYLTTE